ncbi:hypothetical protein FE633_12950 [Streptomyces montanus]|uniref:Uncharacterized protein n=1 Tax=Streptomyces montanus TaxID=2580423 RepID=A0A5R9G2A2_9ACTN|nr:DUF6415 family natural product biosynthesis protein [Streptomyces montanus]TLS45675.1 hypothetical protein FE633_12950 [Streptomyces montanus]
MTVTVEYESTEHQSLPLDTALVGAAIERILNTREPRPEREEADLLALLLRGHLAMLVPEAQAIVDALPNKEERSSFLAQRSVDRAKRLLAEAPTYTARDTVAVVPLADCCRELRLHHAAGSPTPSSS